MGSLGTHIRSEGLVVAGFWGGAGLAENLAVAMDFAIVVDAFTADLTGDASGFVAGHLARVDRNCDPLFAEEVRDGEFAVGEHLLLILVFDVGIEVAGSLLGGFQGGDSDAFVDGGAAFGGQRRSQVDEGGGHLAPVAELYSAFAQAAAGDDGNSVGGAAVDFNKGDQTLAVFWIDQAFGVVNAEALTAQHGQPDTKDLTGAEMAMGDFRFVEEGVEGLHKSMILLTGSGCFFPHLRYVVRRR